MSLWSIILCCGIILMNNVCQSYGTNETNKCHVKKVLFVPKNQQIVSGCCYPTEVVEVGELKLCFDVHTENGPTGCCDSEFNCNVTAYYNGTISSFIMNKKTCSQQDIVVFRADQVFECFPSDFHNKTTDSFLNIHKCMDKDLEFHRLNKTRCCDNNFQDQNTTVTVDCPHKPPDPTPDPTLDQTPDPTPETNNSSENSLDVALDVIKNISFMVEQMDYGETKDIQRGKIRGLINKLPYRNQTNIYIGITEENISIDRDSTRTKTDPSLLVHIPKEASEMALERNGSYVGVFLIPDVHWSISSSYFLDNKTVGIEMGAEISNLSQPINIEFNNVDKKESTASCRSWDGKGKEPTWVQDGCLTNETGDSIICQCSHLTFFAVLMSPPSGNITSSDLSSLTYITAVGCGVSLFFLAVGIFMHSLIRKRKASQGTQILMNLFVAMFTLNLSFLTNDKIANLGNVIACVAVAVCMHYAMLATLTWFFMQALHLYLTLWGHHSEVKRYMLKICIIGWVTPSVIVIPLLALKKYDYLVISADDGTTAKMCWIPNASVQQGVNIGYYSIVFIFTFSIFILTVRQIVCLLPSKAKAGTAGSSIKSNSVSILGLFLLLGITWAFAFFSYGPLLKASYYIFTILNSFHGFFLFIYYYKSSKHDVEKSSASSASGSSSKVTSDAVSTSL